MYVRKHLKHLIKYIYFARLKRRHVTNQKIGFIFKCLTKHIGFQSFKMQITICTRSHLSCFSMFTQWQTAGSWIAVFVHLTRSTIVCTSGSVKAQDDSGMKWSNRSCECKSFFSKDFAKTQLWALVWLSGLKLHCSMPAWEGWVYIHHLRDPLK